MAAFEDAPQETIALTLEEARRLRGSGWGSDAMELDVLRVDVGPDIVDEPSAPTAETRG